MRQLTHSWKTWRFSAIDTAYGNGVLRVCVAVDTASETPETWLFRRTAEPIAYDELSDGAKAVFSRENKSYTTGNIKCCKPGDASPWIVPPAELFMRLATDDGQLAIDFGLFVEGAADNSQEIDPGLADELRRLLDDMDGDE